MTSRELCLDRRKRERKAFVNVLKAVPQARMEYKPDPKSRSQSCSALALSSPTVLS